MLTIPALTLALAAGPLLWLMARSSEEEWFLTQPREDERDGPERDAQWDEELWRG